MIAVGLAAQLEPLCCQCLGLHLHNCEQHDFRSVVTTATSRVTLKSRGYQVLLIDFLIADLLITANRLASATNAILTRPKCLQSCWQASHCTFASSPCAQSQPALVGHVVHRCLHHARDWARSFALDRDLGLLHLMSKCLS